MEYFGFSYIGALWLIMLFVPNILWARNIPDGYTSDGENKILRLFERIGEVSVSCLAVLTRSFNIRNGILQNLWLILSAVLMILYEIYWVRYFKSPKKLRDFYSSLLGIPVAGATLPVAAFAALAAHGRSIPMAAAVLILGIGHIGIHLEHKSKL